MKLFPGSLSGTVAAQPSKSAAHRLLILAALSDRPCRLRCTSLSADVQATVNCLSALGAEIGYDAPWLTVTPLPAALPEAVAADVGESGTTLRFLLPLCGVLGVDADFTMHGRLPERPVEPLLRALEAHGMRFSRGGTVLSCRGKLSPGVYSIPGHISSQFLSGLLLALPRLSGESAVELTSPLESINYVNLTTGLLRRAGIAVGQTAQGFRIPVGQRPRLPEALSVEGDWSGAAAFLCMGALSGPVTVTGLDPESAQGDRRVLALLRAFGAEVAVCGNAVTVSPAPLRAVSFDASDIPDLVPVLAALACGAAGETVITGASRLRMKESDRLAALAAMISALGGKVCKTADGLRITGTPLRGGAADVRGDHRIAMAAAVCSCLCPVELSESDCVRKSWPGFWADLSQLGKECRT